MSRVSIRPVQVNGWSRSVRELYQLTKYRLQGSPVPPPRAIKLKWIRYFQSRFQLHCFVESGTFHGETVAAVANRFDRVLSIELDGRLWENAVQRFRAQPQVTIMQGDSGEVLAHALARFDGPCLFWLDGHYSGGTTAKAERNTPILAELQAIRRYMNPYHVILIDDARLFDGTDDYPTHDKVVDMLQAMNPEYTVRVVDDMYQAFAVKRP